MPEAPIAEAFFDRAPDALARELIGMALLVGETGGIIVETEAYAHDDPASHSFSGPTQRNAAMFGPPGHAYVYRSYGIHWCFNIVAARGSAVLLRALEPTKGLELMRERRSVQETRLLCSGPGRLCQALAITGAHDGLPLDRSPFQLSRGGSRRPPLWIGPRIGISKGRETMWRFGLAGSPYLSRPFRAAAVLG